MTIYLRKRNLWAWVNFTCFPICPQKLSKLKSHSDTNLTSPKNVPRTFVGFEIFHLVSEKYFCWSNKIFNWTNLFCWTLIHFLKTTLLIAKFWQRTVLIIIVGANNYQTIKWKKIQLRTKYRVKTPRSKAKKYDEGYSSMN